MISLIFAAALSCADPATQTQATACAVAAWQASDAQLTRLYHQLPRTPNLVASERAWITYRDAECRYEHLATPEGGMYPMETAACMAAMIKDRIRLLRDAQQQNGYAEAN